MTDRARWIAISLAPAAAVLLSFAVEWRICGGRLAWIGWLVFAFAFFVTGVNVHLAYLRAWLHEVRTGSSEGLRHVSGIPLLGDLTVVALAWMPASRTLSALTLLLMLLNPGSMCWFALAIAREPCS
jgi:hypothetical protein